MNYTILNLLNKEETKDWNAPIIEMINYNQWVFIRNHKNKNWCAFSTTLGELFTAKNYDAAYKKAMILSDKRYFQNFKNVINLFK